jgi:hypothetical protein
MADRMLLYMSSDAKTTSSLDGYLYTYMSWSHGTLCRLSRAVGQVQVLAGQKPVVAGDAVESSSETEYPSICFSNTTGIPSEVLYTQVHDFNQFFWYMDMPWYNSATTFLMLGLRSAINQKV